MTHIHNDGGREAAGYKGSAGDCTVRSIAIATELPYQRVYDDLFHLNKIKKLNPRHNGSPRDGGTHMETVHEYMKSLGWVWTPTMFFGSGCKVHLRKEELPTGRLVVRLSRHLVAVVDGIIHDTYDPSRGGTRCVYGYFSRKKD